MGLLPKLNLIFAIVPGGGPAAIAALSRDSMNRTYTTRQVRPILEQFQRRDRTFYPQIVPAYSATQVFGYLRTAFPEYTYKEATLNPTNLVDRAADWEADVVNVFRNDASRQELFGERDTPTGRSLYLAKPIKVAAACLECHSVPRAAPPPYCALRSQSRLGPERKRFRNHYRCVWRKPNSAL